ncbi:MAG TPA: hypothetical protein VF995_07815 [Actinomycetota bacterium]
MADYHIFETPDTLDQYKQASAKFLDALGRVVYPVLREDPTNESGRFPISYEDGWYTFEVETAGGGLYYLAYQAIEELHRVLVFRLTTFREP